MLTFTNIKDKFVSFITIQEGQPEKKIGKKSHQNTDKLIVRNHVYYDYHFF